MIKGIHLSFDPLKQKTDIVKVKSSPQVSGSAGNITARPPASAAGHGLPGDKLSASIVSFARFFSLPLKPALLADIRRAAFAPVFPQTKETSAAANIITADRNAEGDYSVSQAKAKFREALSLAAAAAESKGVNLQPRGLELYAEAVDPHLRRRDTEQRKRRNRDHNQEKQHHREISGINQLSAESLKKLFYENRENYPLLNILNSLPAKSGTSGEASRWIVLPFDFTEGERQFSISMRILINNTRAVCMALDIITEDQVSGNGDRFLFVIEDANNAPARVTLFIREQLPVKIKSHAALTSQLSQILNIPEDRVFIKTSDESFPYESGFGALMTVDEAV